MNYNLRRFLSPLAMAVIAMPVLAQDSTGTMLGAVLDRDSRRPIADATIEITSNVLIQRRTARTDSNGQFRFPLLPPGEYSVRAIKEGYVGARQTVVINLGGIMRFEMLMQTVSVATDTVEIVGATEIQDKTDVKTQTTYSAEKLDLLPRASKDLWNAATLTPGVIYAQSNRIQMRGAQTFDTKVTIQGAEVNDNVFGTNLNTRAFYADDSISEIQVITSPINARYGNFTGGIINAITKSGSNDFTGVVRVSGITRSSWRSLPPLGPYRPLETESANQRATGTDVLNRNWSVWLGGPILKDRLWFTVSTKFDPPSASTPRLGTLAANRFAYYRGAAWVAGQNQQTGAEWGNAFPDIHTMPFYSGPDQGVSFLYQSSNQFYEGKLTLAIAEGHTIEVTGNKNTTFQDPRYDYIATHNLPTAQSVKQTNLNQYQALSYLGIFPYNITLEARFAKKEQALTAGAPIELGDRLQIVDSNGSVYDIGNGIFSSDDGGDQRNIQTFWTNLTWYSPTTSLGTHVLEGGFEWSKRERNAQNKQSPTDRIFRVAGSYLQTAGDPNSHRFVMNAEILPNGQTDTIGVTRVTLYQTAAGPAENNIYSVYLNDTWTINDNWQVMLGARYDNHKSADTFGKATIEASAFSPRFQATYDPLGNQRWLFKGSWARYVGALSDGFTNRFSMAGNPASEVFLGAINKADATWAEVIDLNNYDLTLNGLYSFTNPMGTRFVDSGLKATGVDETVFEIRYNSPGGSWIRAAFVNRTWANMIDQIFTWGDIVYATAPSFPDAQTPVAAERWANASNIARTYKSLELEWSNQFTRNLSTGGSIVYSVLRGNTDAEASNPPVQGTSVNWMTGVHEQNNRDESYYAPEGYLGSDSPYRISAWLSYLARSRSGASLGATLLFNYSAATPTSAARTLFFEGSELAAAAGLPVTGSFGTSYTRYYAPRGYYRTNDTYSFDLQVNLEIPLYRKVRLFTEATITGLFNQWMLTGYLKDSDTGASLRTDNPLAAAMLPNSFSPRAVPGGINYYGWGTYGFGQFSGQRNLTLAAGLRW